MFVRGSPFWCLGVTPDCSGFIPGDARRNTGDDGDQTRVSTCKAGALLVLALEGPRDRATELGYRGALLRCPTKPCPLKCADEVSSYGKKEEEGE